MKIAMEVDQQWVESIQKSIANVSLALGCLDSDEPGPPNIPRACFIVGILAQTFTDLAESMKGEIDSSTP